MPSLRALEEFKASFQALGDEHRTLQSLGLPIDDFPLPENEPAGGGSTAASLGDEGFNVPGLEGVSAESPGTTGDIGGDSFFNDLSDLLGGMDAEVPQNDFDFPAETSPLDNFALPDELSATDNFGLPDDLSVSDDFGLSDAPSAADLPPGFLDGLGEEIEAVSGQETSPLDDNAFGGGDSFDLGDLGLDGLSGETSPPADFTLPDELSATDDFGLSDAPSATDRPPGFLDGLGEDIAAGSGQAASPLDDNTFGGSDSFDLGDLGLDNLSGETPPPADFALPDELSPSDDLDLSDAPSATDLPPGFLDGFADEIEAERGQAPSSADSPGFDDDLGIDLGDLGLDSFPDIAPVEALPSGGAEFEGAFPKMDSGESFELPPEGDDFPGGLGGFGEGAPGDSSAEIADFSQEEAPAEGDAFNFDDFDMEGFTDTPEPGDSDFSSDSGFPSDTALSMDTGFPEESGLGTESIDFDIGETPAFSDSDTALSTETAFDLSDPAGMMDLSDPADMMDMSDPSDFSGQADSLGAEAFDFPGEDAAFGLGDADDQTTDTSFDEDSFGFGEEMPGLDAGAVLEDTSGDSFGSFNTDSELGAGFGDGDYFDALDEFASPGMDDAFDESPHGISTSASKSAASDEVEEINLSFEELEKLLATLSSYPLNLRIACEELIAEQAVAPEEMSKLIKLLVRGAAARDAARLTGKILGKTIHVPKDYEKLTGIALEEEQSSFSYIFVHNFLPVFKLFLAICFAFLTIGYLSWRFIYTPIRAERIYRLGIERIEAGDYRRAVERFWEAFAIHPRRAWFYTYARAFRDARQFTLAEQKYRELLYFTAARNRRRIPEKAAVLEFADMYTNFIGDFESAQRLLRRYILDFFPEDREALTALGDNYLAWSEHDPSRLEYAREAFARVIENHGRTDPMLERMLIYFIRTDDLEQVLALQSHFMDSRRAVISSTTLAELGGYFLDKRMEEIRGVPNQFLDHIGGIREILLRAIRQDPWLPESYYHLARYYNYFRNFHYEMLTLQAAVHIFDHAPEFNARRIRYHINTLNRYAEVIAGRREFFRAEEYLIRAANLFQNAVSRRLLTSAPEFGRIFANLGDLEYFVKDGNMQRALDYFRVAELHGWAPPEMQFRMGAAHYQLHQWGPALERFTAAHREITPNRRILYALGNASFMRGNYHAAQAYFDRLLEMLNADRDRLPAIMATDDVNQLDLAERLMVAQNNLGVTLEALAERTGNIAYRSRAQGLFIQSELAWDVFTRNPMTMIRMRPSPYITAPGVNPAFLNIQNSLSPIADFEPYFFIRVDMDLLEPSPWEALAPLGPRLSEGVHTGR